MKILKFRKKFGKFSKFCHFFSISNFENGFSSWKFNIFLPNVFSLTRYGYVLSENMMFITKKTLPVRTARTNPQKSSILTDQRQVVILFREGLHISHICHRIMVAQGAPLKITVFIYSFLKFWKILGFYPSYI